LFEQTNKQQSTGTDGKQKQPYQWQTMQLIANTVAALLSFSDSVVVWLLTSVFVYFCNVKHFDVFFLHFLLHFL